ncbi:hypothetical protein HG430_000995 [Candidatus Gracilibacteria bacterium]|nr:hypothetical protein [Candidatus Gracilibacteria bacterium]
MKLYFTEEKKKLFIKASVWNTLIEMFQKEKNIDISEFLVSVKISENNIIIRTNKPILNSELILLQDDLKNNLIEKLEKAEIDFVDFELKFL